MAVWLVRVLDGKDPRPSSPRFVDVEPGEWWAPYVERLGVLAVTRGCALEPARYCPDASVTRGQMATFLTRAFQLEPGPPFGFIDIEGNTHHNSINALAAAELTMGCSKEPARYCPDASVTRGQMATFLTRAIQAAVLSVELDSSTPDTVTGSFEVEITFSAPVTGFDLSDIEVRNGQPTWLTGTGSAYQVTVTPAQVGTVEVWVPANVAHSNDNRGNHASERLVRTSVGGSQNQGPWFDTWDRQTVVDAYRSEFEREQPDPDFTGSVADCEAGTTSQAYRNSILQRLNWYRRMAGLDTVTGRAEYTAAAQQAALMMAAQGRLSHYPGSDWACYTENGALAARRSNLGTTGGGTYGIDRYMKDEGAHNVSVGHRRWILYPRLTQVGIGVIPYDDSSRRTANALYVLGSDIFGTRPDGREQRGFVAWPPAGYVPSQTVWGRWSFQLGAADFGSATVTVTDDYGPIPVEVISRSSGGGASESSIVWAVHGDSNSRDFPQVPSRDYCYTVTVSNVTVSGVSQTPFQYVTCLIDPATERENLGRYVSPPVWSPDGTQIAYLYDGGVWTINADGTDPRLYLLSGTMRWSPDGTRIAHTSNGIWVTNTDGTNPQRLTENGHSPAWSPDSNRLAYVSVTGTGWSATNNGIWVIDSGGTNHQQVATKGSSPVWSPDGSRIAYKNNGIWIANTDGTNPQQLTRENNTPVWSADGEKIIYGNRYGTWTINADGTNQHQLASIGPPVLSPDGSRIAYANNGIWIANTDGTNPQQLTTSGSSPAWSPDGTRIAYNEWGHQLWVVNADGTDQHQLSK